MLLFTLSTLLKAEEESKLVGLREDGLCEGNRFLFLSTYILGRQQDLTLTFQDINQTHKSTRSSTAMNSTAPTASSTSHKTSPTSKANRPLNSSAKTSCESPTGQSV